MSSMICRLVSSLAVLLQIGDLINDLILINVVYWVLLIITDSSELCQVTILFFFISWIKFTMLCSRFVDKCTSILELALLMFFSFDDLTRIWYKLRLAVMSFFSQWAEFGALGHFFWPPCHHQIGRTRDTLKKTFVGLRNYLVWEITLYAANITWKHLNYIRYVIRKEFFCSSEKFQALVK